MSQLLESRLEQRKKDHAYLHEAFHLSLDLSEAENWLKRCFVGGKYHLPELGHGHFFRCFRLPHLSKAKMPLALKCWSPFFLSSPQARRPLLRKIESSLKWVRKNSPRFELLAPLELVQAGEMLGWVMPLGECLAPAEQWMPIAQPLKKLELQLKSSGVKILDGYQLRSWSGVPFLVDYSDFEVLER